MRLAGAHVTPEIAFMSVPVVTGTAFRCLSRNGWTKAAAPPGRLALDRHRQRHYFYLSRSIFATAVFLYLQILQPPACLATGAGRRQAGTGGPTARSQHHFQPSLQALANPGAPFDLHRLADSFVRTLSCLQISAEQRLARGGNQPTGHSAPTRPVLRGYPRSATGAVKV